jgi:hypothetical protein
MVVLTAAALIAAGISFQEQRQYQLPTTVLLGSTGNPTSHQVVARHVVEGSGAERGIREATSQENRQQGLLAGYPIQQQSMPPA